MYFIQLAIQAKASNDWRAFVYFKENFSDTDEIELRGYGSTLREAAMDAVTKFEEYEPE